MPPDPRSVLHLSGYDEDANRVDNIGRQQPTEFNLVWAFRAVPQMAEQFKRRVPDSFTANEVEEDGTPVITVACPCGESPRVRLASIHECKCERFYLGLKSEVRVANSPVADPEPQPEESPEIPA